MRSDVKSAALLLVLASAGGCVQVDPGMGEALKYDQAIQTINPDPVYPPSGAQPGDNGDAAVAAAKRYRLGTVKQIERLSASSSAQGESGGSGSGPK